MVKKLKCQNLTQKKRLFPRKKSEILKYYFWLKKNAILLVFQYEENAIQPELSSPACFRIQRG